MHSLQRGDHSVAHFCGAHFPHPGFENIRNSDLQIAHLVFKSEELLGGSQRDERRGGVKLIQARIEDPCHAEPLGLGEKPRLTPDPEPRPPAASISRQATKIDVN